ncbi:MAG: 2,3-bisphosphoglycerate-dependent phosphoglycerate mutase [Nitrospirales bacterium]|nr:2,3-bisphosphoglycerate-dependent phosphoglycerate mutase [Nitrospirales bacterium]
MRQMVLIRHGQSQWNLENRFTGWVDVPLSSHGEEEAREAGEKLKPYQFDLAFTSLLMRAQETLRLILVASNQSGIPIEKTEALNERMYGELQGLNKDETIKQYGEEQVKLWRRSYDVQPPGGESLKDTAARVLPYYQQTIWPAVQAGKRIIVAAHGNSLRAMVMHIDGLSPNEVLELNIPTGMPLVYEFDDTGAVTRHEYL